LDETCTLRFGQEYDIDANIVTANHHPFEDLLKLEVFANQYQYLIYIKEMSQILTTANAHTGRDGQSYPLPQGYLQRIYDIESILRCDIKDKQKLCKEEEKHPTSHKEKQDARLENRQLNKSTTTANQLQTKSILVEALQSKVNNQLFDPDPCDEVLDEKPKKACKNMLKTKSIKKEKSREGRR
jgi:hypothetical protein